jgi:hypothetical protein
MKELILMGQIVLEEYFPLKCWDQVTVGRTIESLKEWNPQLHCCEC